MKKLKVLLSVSLSISLFLLSMPVYAANVERVSKSEMELFSESSSELENLRSEREKDGWVLINTEYETVKENIISPFAASKVEGYYIVVDTYTQPIKKKEYTNSALLDAVINYSKPIASVIGAGLPQYKWIPAAVGFVSREIAKASASCLSVFMAPETLYVRSVMVKTNQNNQYCPWAEADRLVAVMSATFAGYDANGNPFSNYTEKILDVKSPFYDNDSNLIEIACARARSNADSPYSEHYIVPAEY